MNQTIMYLLQQRESILLTFLLGSLGVLTYKETITDYVYLNLYLTFISLTYYKYFV